MPSAASPAESGRVGRNESSSCPEQAAPSISDHVPFALVFLAGGAAVTAAAIYFGRRRRGSAESPPQIPVADPRDSFVSREERATKQSTNSSQTAAAALARAWLAIDPDQETRNIVNSWLSSRGDSSEDSDTKYRVTLDSLDPSSCASKLSFGTAGVRARVGVGYACLNCVTVTGVGQAIASVFTPSSISTPTVIIGYDARRSSRKFALILAQIFHTAGVSDIRLFSSAVPTPLAAFAALRSDASVSLVVTASHNPPADNGIKVYASDAIQLRPVAAAKVEARLSSNMKPWASYSLQESQVIPLTTDPLASSRSEYLLSVPPAIQLRSRSENAKAPLAVYTACHGVGYSLVRDMVHAFGLPSVIPCEEQCTPDPDFPTLPFPNPEEKGALDLAIATARSNHASIVLANDPDADRFAAAELTGDDGSDVRVFSGDEIATLLADYITTRLRDRGADVSNCAVVNSTVSSKILKSMASTRGFSFHESLTGFKWLNKTAIDVQASGKTVILTYEEAIGFNVTRNLVRDKDGVSALALFYELCGYWYDSGKSLRQRYEELLLECGVHLSKNGYLRLSSSSPSTETIFDSARSNGLPSRFGKAYVKSCQDITRGTDTSGADGKSGYPADPSSQFLTFRCTFNLSEKETPLIIHLRGSGTGSFNSSLFLQDAVLVMFFQFLTVFFLLSHYRRAENQVLFGN